MSLSPEETVVSDLLEDLSAGQPPAPPDRYRAIRRRIVRHRWHRAATTGAALAVIAAGQTVLSLLPSAAPGWPAASASLPISPASYLGVYEAGALASYQPIADFAAVAGRQPNLIGWPTVFTAPFSSAFAKTAHDHGAALIVQIDPTHASLAAIAAGHYDAYLRSYAGSVRNFGHPVVIGFGHEMNAEWYPWGYHHASPARFVQAWRHIVAVFRSQGADNVTWLWTVQADSTGTGPLRAWWPGRRYVTWVGIDGYYAHPADTFASVFGKSIDQVRHFTGKPVLLSETSVAPAAGQFAKIQDLFLGMARYKTLGLVWFDLAQGHGNFRDWRIEGDPPAATSLRLGVRDEIEPSGLPFP